VVLAPELLVLAGTTAPLVGAIVAVPRVIAHLAGRETVQLIDRVARPLVLDAEALYLVRQIEALMQLGRTVVNNN